MQTLIIDLDHTLLNTTDWVEDLANSITMDMQSWDKALKQFSSPQDLLTTISIEERKAFMQVVDDIQEYLYEDSYDFLDRVLQNEWQVTILTYGHKAWQELKLSKLRFPQGVRNMVTDQLKVDLVGKMIKGHTILIDDRADEIDSIKTQYPDIEAYWMQRDNGKYRDTPPQLADKIINDLTLWL